MDLTWVKNGKVLAAVCVGAALCGVGCEKSESKAAEPAKVELKGEPLMAEKPAAPPQTKPADAKETAEQTAAGLGVDKQFIPGVLADPGAAALPTAADLPEVKTVEGYAPVGFAKLAGYTYETDAAIVGAHTPPVALEAGEKAGAEKKKGDEQIPADVKALSGKPITVQGFMVPIDFRKGGSNEFILVSVIPSCFFCQVPMPNQWVEVKMKDGERVPYPGDELITVAGTIEIGAKFEGEYFQSLYRMEGHKVVPHGK